MRPKQALLLGIVVLSGCGGGSTEDVATPVSVAAQGVSFQAPAGWEANAQGKAAATRGSELVQVRQFSLLKPYRPALFERVQRELDRTVGALAKASGGTVSEHTTVDVGGTRSHSYAVEVGDHVDEYTFVLRGRREYQLLCRRESSGDDDACRLLVTSFATT